MIVDNETVSESANNRDADNGTVSNEIVNSEAVNNETTDSRATDNRTASEGVPRPTTPTQNTENTTATSVGTRNNDDDLYSATPRLSSRSGITPAADPPVPSSSNDPVQRHEKG